ncbi:U-box domain-containing protein 18-like [Wolffia australiana]
MERRFLAMPAAAPWEGVSPAALLQALVAIGGDVRRRFRSMFFPTQRRFAREMARQVAILADFSSEVRNFDLPESAIVGFSEIYVAFLKIRHLINDCGRRGARILVLVKSDLVASEFHVLARSIATALSVLPLERIDAPSEAKEAVKLVEDQAWRVDFSVEPVDESMCKGLRSILGQFERGTVPDRDSVARILDHLKIQSWSDCDAEIQFLEDEISASLASGGNLDQMFLLSGLRGFILYARSLLFDVKSGRKPPKSDPQFDHPIPNFQDLEQFRCPISLEPMTDPVTVSTGHTYERSSIAKWLAAGNRTCPVTGAPLRTTELVPNVALHRLILQLFPHQRSVPSEGRRQFSKDMLPQIPAAVGAIVALCRLVVGKLAAGPEELKARAVSEIRLLSKTSLYERGCLVAAGAVPLLLDLHYSLNSSLQDGATAAILNLSKHHDGKTAIFEYQGLAPVLHALTQGLKPDARQNAAATLFYLASVEHYRAEIGETPAAIPALVELLSTGTDRGKKNAAVALIRLLYFPGNHGKVLAAGTVAALVALLSSEKEDLVGDCLAALAAIAEQPEGAIEILQASAMPSLVRILLSHSSRSGKEYCLSVLLHLCSAGGDRVVALLERVPTLVPALRLVLSEGSARVSKKASSLIRLLRQDRAALPLLPDPQRGPVPA